MCGIVAYLGKKAAQPILVEGLKRLEFRGYDSAGIALLRKDGICVKKTSGRISVLERILDSPANCDVLGIGHTRWATHGEPNTVNAHPHTDYTGKIAVVHNGIIENYSTLKTWLRSEGVAFVSQTDTEVLANLIGYLYCHRENSHGGSDQNQFEWAVQQALQKVHGTFGVAIVCCDFPDILIGAKRGSPLILGVGDGEYILASDAAAIVEHTTRAIYLSDNEMVTVSSNGFYTKTINNVVVAKDMKEIEFSLEQIELGGKFWRFVDTAGIRRRVNLAQGADFYATLRTSAALEKAEVAVVVLDVTEPISVQDLKIIDLVLESGRALVLAYNKWDLLDDERRIYLEKEIERDLSHVTWAPRVNISAKTGRHLEKLVPALELALASWDTRIPTGKFNALLAELTAEHPHPVRGGKQPRILFGTQAASRPPTFVLFTTGFLDPQYRRFITRRLREIFGFEGSPINVNMRVREKRKR